jgi:hypothetical protein
MSYYLKPNSIEAEINEKFRYTRDSDVDEFTLCSYHQKLQQIKENRNLTVQEYVALGLVLFNRKKYLEFFDLFQDAKRQYPKELILHKHDTIGRFHIKNNRILPLNDFDLFEYWFDEEYNPEKEPINFLHGTKTFLFFDRKYDLEKEIVIDLKLYNTSKIIIEGGPFRIERKYDDVKANNFRLEDTVLFEYLENVRRNDLMEDQVSFMKDILGEEQHNEILCFVDREVNKQTKEIIDKTDRGIDVKIIDADSDLLSSLDSDA